MKFRPAFLSISFCIGIDVMFPTGATAKVATTMQLLDTQVRSRHTVRQLSGHAGRNYDLMLGDAHHTLGR
jgi:hypothetical protein